MNKDEEFGNLAMLIGGKIIKIVHNEEEIGTVWGLVIELKDKSRVTMLMLSDFEGNAPGAWWIQQ
jgi:hypothetical protein